MTDAAVHGEPHPITGQIVAATVVLDRDEPVAAFKVRMRLALKDKVPSFKVPAKVVIATGPVYSARFKRMRKAEPV